MKDWRKSPEPSGMMGGGVRGDDDSIRENELFSHSIHVEPSSSTISTSEFRFQQIASPAISSPSHSQPPQADHLESPKQSSVRQRTKVDISLGEMARRVITQKIHLYESLGDAPFSIVRFVLEQCSPSKLWGFEEETPDYIQYTSYIWKRFCLRDFKDVQQLYSSGRVDFENFSSWRELYHTKVVQDFEAKEAATARIKEKYAALRANKEANQVRIVTEAPIPVGRRSNFVISNGNRTLGSQSTQGQRMLHKARRKVETSAKDVRIPLRKNSSPIRPIKVHSINASNARLKPKLASPTIPASSSHMSSSTAPSNATREPPGFERKATFFDAEKLESAAIKQLLEATIQASDLKRKCQGANDDVYRPVQQKKPKPIKSIGGETCKTPSDSSNNSVRSMSSYPTLSTTRRSIGSGISVRTKRISPANHSA